MTILQIVGLCFIVTLLSLLLRRDKPEIALQLSLALAAFIFIFLAGKIGVVLDLLQNLADKAGMSQMYMATILKIIGIAYVSEFGAQVCRDAGEGAIAAKIEIAAKIMIVIMAVPIIVLVIDTVGRLLPA